MFPPISPKSFHESPGIPKTGRLGLDHIIAASNPNRISITDALCDSPSGNPVVYGKSFQNLFLKTQEMTEKGHIAHYERKETGT